MRVEDHGKLRVAGILLPKQLPCSRKMVNFARIVPPVILARSQTTGGDDAVGCWSANINSTLFQALDLTQGSLHPWIQAKVSRNLYMVPSRIFWPVWTSVCTSSTAQALSRPPEAMMNMAISKKASMVLARTSPLWDRFDLQASGSWIFAGWGAEIYAWRAANTTATARPFKGKDTLVQQNHDNNAIKWKWTKAWKLTMI